MSSKKSPGVGKHGNRRGRPPKAAAPAPVATQKPTWKERAERSAPPAPAVEVKDDAPPLPDFTMPAPGTTSPGSAAPGAPAAEGATAAGIQNPLTEAPEIAEDEPAAAGGGSGGEVIVGRVVEQVPRHEDPRHYRPLVVPVGYLMRFPLGWAADGADKERPTYHDLVTPASKGEPSLAEVGAQLIVACTPEGAGPIDPRLALGAHFLFGCLAMVENQKDKPKPKEPTPGARTLGGAPVPDKAPTTPRPAPAAPPKESAGDDEGGDDDEDAFCVHT